LLSGRGKTLAAVLLLFAASAVSATPTVTSDKPICAASISTDNAGAVAVYDFSSNAVSSHISELAKSFLKPPQFDSKPAESPGNNNCLFLPALPPAILMVFTGFICISSIRDRRAWLAVFAFAFGLGQAGIKVLPELTSSLCRKALNNQSSEAKLAVTYHPVCNYYPANYSEQIRYTGLLRHLEGITSNSFSPFNNNHVSLTRLCRREYKAAGNVLYTSQAALTLAQLVLDKLVNCLVSGTRQFDCFQPAFIFCMIPRGPPVFQMRLFL
jgi:hypothetical protein